RTLDAPVIVDNDMNFAVLGEHWRGAAREHERCEVISVVAGTCARITVNGVLLAGCNCLARESALMSMGPRYWAPDSGRRCRVVWSPASCPRPARSSSPYWAKTPVSGAACWLR